MPVQYKDPGAVRTKESDFVPRLPPIADSSLEKAVFTHPGVGNNDGATYDRLEILGDAYIELMATKLVWERFRELPSGRISQIRESLVKNETLSEFASKYGFDSKALVPRDYLGQPKRWIKTKGDIFEAYVAAVILSDTANGYKVVEDWLTALWTPQLTTTKAQTICLNAKEALAKKIMGKGIELRYVDERPPIQLEGGKQTFFTRVYLTGWGWNNTHLGSGQGPNKAIAGDQAARQALQNEELISEITSVKEAYKANQNKNN
ncbi:ribonuclease [Aspergillus sclerotialis]|uniref:Ribonuclease n=1 Tax=Aspergillus sclerotialis TaxID=2070753 RepID=A0A3A2ZSG1_9EURO|nr:ribonuclease [Aspergillus sclerotialis]